MYPTPATNRANMPTGMYATNREPSRPERSQEPISTGFEASEPLDSSPISSHIGEYRHAGSGVAAGGDL